MTSKLSIWSAAALSVAATACLSCGQPAFGQDETDTRLGNVHFATSCNETAQRRFDRAMRYQHSFWYRESKEIFEEAHQGRSRMRDRVLGRRAELAQQPAQPTARPQSPARACRHPEGEGGRRQDRSRARFHRRAVGVLYRLRQGPAWRAGAALSQGDGGGGAAQSRRRRSAAVLRHHAQCRRLAERQDLFKPAQGRGDPGADLQAPAAASGRRPLSDPSLRLSGPGGERHRCRQALCRDRAGRAARAAHALAHLHARRLLERIDRLQHRLGARGKGQQGFRRAAARLGLPGLCLSAARAGRRKRARSSTT